MPFTNQIVGTIISSVLEFSQLMGETDEPLPINNTRTSYVPCDGRSIVGSKLHRITRMTNAPDLRGKFIRGLNQFFNDGEPRFDPTRGDTDAGRVVASYQADDFKSHNHSVFNVIDVKDGNEKSAIGLNPGNPRETGLTGGQETRPRNIAVYFYIKIN